MIADASHEQIVPNREKRPLKQRPGIGVVVLRMTVAMQTNGPEKPAASMMPAKDPAESHEMTAQILMTVRVGLDPESAPPAQASPQKRKQPHEKNQGSRPGKT